MRHKIANLILAALEMGCIAGLTGMAIYAECKRHKAEKALSEAELECATYRFCDYVKGLKIKDLEKELEELKKKGEA
jgi:hypothetical protein